MCALPNPNHGLCQAEPAPPQPVTQGLGATHAAPTSIDFEAGRFFERAEKGTLDQEEFQRLWRAARAGESAPPPPSALPLPADFDAGARFDRFDRCI